MTRRPARRPEVELAGTDELDAILDHARRQLRDSIAAAVKDGKTPRETTREVRVDSRWGWTYWQVDEQGTHNTLVEVAITRPGTGRGHRTLLTANSDNAGRLKTLGGIAGGGLGAIGGMAGFAVTAPALAITGAGAAVGIGAGWWIRHRLNRWLGDSVRLREGVLSRLPASRAAQSMNVIASKISDFHTHMAAVAAHHGTDPVPLPLDQTPDYLLAEIHQAVWDLASEQTSNTDGEILTELWRIGKAVDDAIDAAWSTWHATQVQIPPDPALRRPTLDRLSRLTGTVRDAHTASSQAAQDLRAINQPERGQ